jgi:two-component system CitB family sensor kinase
MVYEHEAVLRGIGEGVLAVDEHGLVSVRNAEAERLLGVALPIGTPVESLAVSPRVRVALAQPPVDNVFAIAGDRVVVVNSRPVRREKRELGTVLTVRDRTDLDALTRELDSVRSLTDGLRASRHEYSNRLHTLSGLLQLDHRDEAIEYLNTLTDSGRASGAPLDVSVRDPYLGALLLAKSEQAGEKGVTLRMSDDSALVGRVGEPVAVTMVLGNLLDNALHAAQIGPRRPAWIEVTVLTEGRAIHLSVQDSGLGITLEPPDSVFEEGVTSKLTPGHGLGLALARHEARRLGGDLWIGQPGGPASGALFVAALPATLATEDGDAR